MKKPEDDTPPAANHTDAHDKPSTSSTRPFASVPFGAGTDAPLEDFPVPGDSHSKHSYYYDDATNYKVFNPDEEDE